MNRGPQGILAVLLLLGMVFELLIEQPFVRGAASRQEAARGIGYGSQCFDNASSRR
jgi:hypothetical protein